MNINLQCRLVCTIALILSVLGCSNGNHGPISVADYNKTNIKRLRNAYGLYQNANGRSPKDEAQLKEFLTGNAATKVRLKRMGVTQDMVDGIFISERDEKPFKVRYGIKESGDAAIVFESEGVDGKRMVAFYDPRELDAAEYEGYLSGKLKGKKEADFDPRSE